MPPGFESVAQAVKRMAVSSAKFYREVKAGRLVLVKIGARAVAVQSSEVDAWLDAQLKDLGLGGQPAALLEIKAEHLRVVRAVALLLSKGLDSKEAASILGITSRQVCAYRTQAQKMGLCRE